MGKEDTFLIANIISEIKEEAHHLKNPPLIKRKKISKENKLKRISLLGRLKGVIRKFDLTIQRVKVYKNGIRPIIKKVYKKIIKRD